MPQFFKIGGYIIYFWINEGMPLEPIHVHVAEGRPTQRVQKTSKYKAFGTFLLFK